MVLPTTDPDIETLFKDKAKTRVLEDLDGSTVFAPWDYGKTVFYGRSNAEKMAIMAVNSVLVMVEGGPGALKEALGCQQNGHWVVPVRCTGGATTNAEVGRQSPFKDLLRLASKKDPLRGEVALGAGGPAGLGAARRRGGDRPCEGCRRGGDRGEPAFLQAARAEGVQPDGDRRGKRREPPTGAAGAGGRRGRSHLVRQRLQGGGPLQRFRGESAVRQHGRGRGDSQADRQRPGRCLRRGPDWLVLYGGSPYLKDVKTIAHAVRLLHERYGKTVLAVQCDFYGKEMLAPPSKEAYAHMADGALYMYPTETALDEHFHKKILFGGYYRFCGDKQEKLCGASKVWYGPELAELDMISAHVVIGGGSLAADDANESYQQRIPTFYARTRLRSTRQRRS
ncbi:unnamed protein product [Prorocentrum cordatum]|uniref:Uncharacterized protein n=1 Tax=Prorocentrum cordatum TaxID=2364126 RepID=A0ABN9SIF1_9DINO|nr:unnamed protein product [Polarella glacialis]